MKTFTSVCMVLLLFGASCQKNVEEAEDPNTKKANEFRTYLTAGSIFRAVDFYAEQPIDYNELDNEVILETDLKKYIRNYLLDDDIIFGASGMITFVQNDAKISNNDAAEISVPYQVRPTETGVQMDYVDDQYNPLTYDLHEQTTTYFVLSWKRPNDGIRLFSRYEKVL